MTDLIPADFIERRIYTLRGAEVMLGPDLAAMFGVEHKALNQAVKRNRVRFPDDFVFQLSTDEWAALRSQPVTLDSETGSTSGLSRSQSVTESVSGRGRYIPPYAFTEQGVAMLSSVLHSEQAIAVNIAIMRAFVRMRRLMATNRELAQRLEELERKHDAMAQTTDHNFREVVEAIHKLMKEPPSTKQIGFRPAEPGEPRPRSKRTKSGG